MESTSAKIKEVDALDILKEIFDNVNRWLIFAETKNGVLISINGVLLFRLLDYLEEFDSSNSLLNIKATWILIIIFLIAIIFTLKSFFPNCSSFIDEGDNVHEYVSSNSSILLYYNDISKYDSAKLYLKDIYKHYLNVDVDIKKLNKYELDYAKEIIFNSKIACYKYKCFKFALVLNGLGILLLVLFSFIC